MAVQRSPLAVLLPEARVISMAGFSNFTAPAVTAIAGLCAFNAVSGASTVAQVSPTAGSVTVNGTGAQPLAFLFNYTGSDTPDHFQVTGTLPAGLTQTGSRDSKSDSITGIPLASGNFPITVRAWRDADQTSDSVSKNFTIVLAAPPPPAIQTQPAPAVSATGGMAAMTVVQSSGFNFTWKKGGAALPVQETLLISRTSPRRFLVPASDPGAAWRTGEPFSDTAWTSVSGGIGYDTDATPVNYLPFVATGGAVASGKTSALIRIPFTLTSHAALSYLKLRVQCDDGYVAWLNGTEISSQSKPATLAWNSAAARGANDAAAVVFREIDLPGRLGLLHAGGNLLAVQALNTASSSDMLFNCELSAGINDINSPNLVLAGIQPSDAGDYTVTVTNTAGAVTSNPAVLILSPVIDIQPAAASIVSGTAAQLHVTASVSPPFTYQWYRGTAGDTSDPVTGATLADLTTPVLTATTAFWVRVTNAAGSTDSTAATVTVTTAPPAISVQPASLAIDRGATAQLSVASSGTAPLNYQWYEGSAGDISHPVANAVAASFTTPGLTETTRYWVRISNASGSVDSETAIVTVKSVDTFSTWRAAKFTAADAANEAVSGPAADPDRDGRTNEQEYVFGTEPMTSGPPPALSITLAGGQPAVSFTAIAVSGAGYTGRTRLYTVETADRTDATVWTAVSGFEQIAGQGQSVTAPLSIAGTKKYYRLKVSLTP